MTKTEFHMPIEDVLDLISGDYEVPVRQIRPMMYSQDSEFCWHTDEGWNTCAEYINYLAARMREFGWDGPPVCIVGRTLPNGHHRVLAAWDAELQEIPYTNDWEESGGSSW